MLVWSREIKNFMTYFHLPTSGDEKVNEFVKKVQELQKGLPAQDGVMWPKFIRFLYMNYYSKDLDKLDATSKARWEIYKEMLGYEKKSWALYKFLDPFHINDFYGKYVGMNKEWTFINENLEKDIPHEIEDKNPRINIAKVGDKRYLAFYIDGKLHLATYVSPWLLTNRTQKVVKKWEKTPDKYHISSSYPTLAESKNGKVWGFVMPYAVHVDGSVWIHASDSRIDGSLQSHWCIRTPLFYVKEIYDKVKEFWIDKVTIDTTGIY